MSQVIKISLDDKGRILIPAALRSRLGLSPGMNLVVEDGDQDSVRLRVQSRPPVLVDKAGVLVVRAEPLSDGSLGLCVVRALESPTCWGIHAQNPNKFGPPTRYPAKSQRP